MRHGCKETRGEIQDLSARRWSSIRTESLTDPLTTLANRKHLDRTLLQAVDHAALSAEPLTVLMIDVDKFKDFNDTWGHLTGDQVLRLVAMSIKGEVRPADTAARFGGEEFAIILPQSSLKSASARGRAHPPDCHEPRTGEALHRRGAGPTDGLDRHRRFTKGDTAALLLERADRCLLEAKRDWPQPLRHRSRYGTTRRPIPSLRLSGTSLRPRRIWPRSAGSRRRSDSST